MAWRDSAYCTRPANDAILAAGQHVLIDDPTRFDGVRVLGVDEHCWRHVGVGEKFVTVMIDLTPVHDQTGPARLLDIVEGRSKKVFTTWLHARPKAWREQVEVVAMVPRKREVPPGFTGFKTAAAEHLPHATTVLDPFHVVALIGLALDTCRQRVQQATLGRRGRTGDPLYAARKTLRTGSDLLTEKQQHRLAAVFADDNHVAVEVMWSVYQDFIQGYRDPNKEAGKALIQNSIAKLNDNIPKGLPELKRIGATLNRRRDDILAYFDRPRTSNGPTEAINGRLENLRGNALGFRNLTNYIRRCLLDAGGFRPQLHPAL